MDQTAAIEAVNAAFWGGMWLGGLLGVVALYAAAYVRRWWQERQP